ncbi:MAG: thiamine kinase-like enzyme [Planctomycetaceae bacterium]|jgi:thiamine kinase-like enzyme
MSVPEILTHAKVPFSLEEINADWLTISLREAGIIGEEFVQDLDLNVIGTEAGFNGEVAILNLQYSDDQVTAPTSMVLKIPTPLKNRIMAQTMGLYEKEIRFYRDLKPLLGVRTPQHFYSALNAADDPDIVAERMQGLNKLPMWFIAVLTKFATWMIASTPRRYVLLIEDLSGYRMGDQMQACTIEDTHCILSAMASMHAQFWDSEQLAAMSWIAPVATSSKIIHLMYKQTIGKIRSANKQNFTARQLELIEWLIENGIALTNIQGNEVSTLLHGDLRLDNICFDDVNNQAVLFDWQTMQNGPAGMDLAYFLSATVAADAGQREIDELISFYHQQLTSNGVEISSAKLRWQYEIGMLAMVHRILPTLHPDRMDLGSERGVKMMQAWMDKIFRKVEHIQFGTILERVPD